MYQALYRKYRPRRFEDVVGQDHITQTLRRQVETGRTGHAYIFVGTRGTGKTTCAKILSKALNCRHPVNGDPCNECDACRGIDSGAIMDVIEIDAASNGGVEDIRALREAANYTPADVRKRVYILDEAHMLSTAAFPALLKILEEPPEHLVFILATTDLAKIPITILSRCQHFSFRRIMPEDIAGRLKYVAGQEGFALTEGAAGLLARLGDGSMRDALSLLDQCLPANRVDEDAVIRAVGIMGAEDTVRLWNAAASRDTALALSLFDKSYRGGAEPISILRDLLSLTRDMLMVRVAPQGSASLLTGAFDAGRLAELCKTVDTGRLVAVSELLQEDVNSMKDARDKRVKAELCLVKVIGALTGAYAPPESFAPAPATKPAEPREAAPQRKKQAPEPGSPAPVTEMTASEKAAPAPDPEPDLPPWEDGDIPPEPGEEPPAPPWEDMPAEPAPEPVPAPMPEPVPASAAEPAGDVQGDWWGRVLKKCAALLDPTQMGPLSARESAVPRLADTRLTLYARNMFVQMMIDTDSVRDAVSKAAAEVLGKPIGVSVVIGTPPEDAAAPKKPGLDDLARFDGIVKFT